MCSSDLCHQQVTPGDVPHTFTTSNCPCAHGGRAHLTSHAVPGGGCPHLDKVDKGGALQTLPPSWGLVVPVLGRHLHTCSSLCCYHHFWEAPQEEGCEDSA